MDKKKVKVSIIANKPLRKAYMARRCVVVYMTPKRVVKVSRVERRRRSTSTQEEEDIKKKIAEAQEKLKKLKEENRVKEVTIRLLKFMETGNIPSDLGADELDEMDRVIQMKLAELDKLIAEKEAAEGDAAEEDDNDMENAN